MERGGRRGDVRAGTAHLVEGAEVLEDERAGLELPGGEHLMATARFMGKKAHGVMQVRSPARARRAHLPTRRRRTPAS